MISCEPDPDERSAGVAGAQSMKLPRRRFLHLAAGATALPAVSRIASAQTYPSRPITIVVPAAAGGPLDVLARILSERMRLSLAQPLLIENVAGAAGSIGLHAQYGHVGHARREPGNLRSFVRRGEGFRAGLADREHAGADSREEGHSGERPQGSYRLAKG